MPIVILIVIFAIWLAWAFFSRTIFGALFGVDAFDVIGQWGDSFGAFNVLVSLFGFTVVVASLEMQRKSATTQAKDVHTQRFDVTFFELLRLMRTLREEVSFRYSVEYIAHFNSRGVEKISKKSRRGRAAFVAATLEAAYWMRKEPDRSSRGQRLGVIYSDRVHKRSESTLAPYFRLIYTILARLRDDQTLSDQQKQEYGNLLRSQITSTEVKLLAMNGLAPVSMDMKDLLIQFRFMKYLPEGTMRTALETVYPPEAFMTRS